jgi:hypothetical protein
MAGRWGVGLASFPLRPQLELGGRNDLKPIFQNPFENLLELGRAQDFRSSIERHIKAPVRPIDRVRQFISAEGVKHPVELPAIAVHFEILDDSSTHFFAFNLDQA